ncbi:MAG: pseudouridylate synthase [Spirochaetales bacterium]|nr:pseudouridylate synthase [Spirochaetales bacterium]
MNVQGHPTECTILYSDNEVCAVIKPPGMFVHPSALDRRVPDCRTYLEHTLRARLYNVHRIDRPASGVVIYARSRDAASDISFQFRERTIKKRYLAVVRGHLNDVIRADSPIGNERGSDAVPASSRLIPLAHSVVAKPVGKFAEGWFSLVEVDLETGRPHQARRHLKRAGHPIVGDTQHGDPHQNRFVKEFTGWPYLALMAYSISFRHPAQDLAITCCAGIPDWWEPLLDGLSLQVPSDISQDASAVNIT